MELKHILLALILAILIVATLQYGLSRSSQLEKKFQGKLFSLSYSSNMLSILLLRENHRIFVNAKYPCILLSYTGVIIDYVDYENGHYLVDYIILLGSHEGNITSFNIILKVNPEENNVYHLNGSLIGKWIYGLDKSLRNLEEKKPVLNCTCISRSWRGRTVYGNCVRQGNKVGITAYAGSLDMCGSRFDVYVNYFYNVKNTLLTETFGLIDDVLYRVYGVYYVDHPSLILQAYGENIVKNSIQTIGNDKFSINKIYISLSPTMCITFRSSIEGTLKIILPNGREYNAQIHTTDYGHVFLPFGKKLATPPYGKYHVVIIDRTGNVVWESDLELEKYRLNIINASLNVRKEKAIFEVENRGDIPTYIAKVKIIINDLFFIEENVPFIPMRALSINKVTLNIPIDLPPEEVRKVDVILINDRGDEVLSYSFKM